MPASDTRAMGVTKGVPDVQDEGDASALLGGPGLKTLELSHDAGGHPDQIHYSTANLQFMNSQRQDSDTVKLLGTDEDQEGTGLLPDHQDSQYMRRVLASSMIGNLLEWYDFLLYSLMGSTISKLFFPAASTYAQALSYWGVFAGGFLTRPLGALIFGRIADKYGRRLALSLSIYLMSLPTAAVGCLPTFAQAGIGATVLLVLLRIVQGLAVGGEFTGTMVFLVESAPPDRQGLHGSFAFTSVMTGVILGSLVAVGFNSLDDKHLYTWGWRIPFLLSLVGAAIGAYIRKYLKEPPQIEASHSHGGGLTKVLLSMITVFLIDFITAIGFYEVVIFLPLYFQLYGGLSRVQALSIHTANMVVYMGAVPVGGWLSDKYGRVPIIVGPCAAMMVGGYPLWAMFKAHNAFLSWLSQALMCVGMGLINGVLPACFINLFPAQLRCTGVSVAHNLSMALFGGTAPLMATAILHGTSDIASPSALMIIACALSICGAMLVHKAQRVQNPA